MPRKTAAQIRAEAEATVADVATTGLNDALFKLQGVMPAFQTDEINPHLHNKYLSINTMMPKLLVLLRSHGLLLVQAVSNIDGAPALHTTLTHVASGECIGHSAPLSSDKSTPQAQGSAITYMRRYALVAMLGLVIEKDDDGHAGSAPTTFKTAPAEPVATPDNQTAQATFGQPQSSPFGAAL